MLKFVDGVNYFQCAKDILSSSKTSDVAVAFLGEGAEDIIPDRAVIRIICNLGSGATNPAVVEKLLNIPSVDMRSLDNLHAKVFISDRAILLGSANISANGLGLEGIEVARWEEAGILTEDASAVESGRQWFARLWSAAKAISSEELSRAKLKWERRRHVRPASKPGDPKEGLFAQLMGDWALCKDRPLYLVVYQNCITKDASNALEELRERGKYGSSFIDCYEGWPDFPVNARILDFHRGPKGGITPYGAYWTGPEKVVEKVNYEDGSSGEIQIVFKSESYEGLRVIKKERDWFSDQIRPYIGKLLEVKDTDKDNAICLPLNEAFNEMSLHGLRPIKFYQ